MPEKSEPRVFRLKCAKCGGVVVCPESIVETGGACSDCGHPIQIEAYEALRKLRDEHEAARIAEKQHQEEERRAQKAAAERQREEERERVRVEAARTQQRDLWEKQLRQEELARQGTQRRLHEEQLRGDAARSQATAAVPDVPKYAALEVTSTLLSAFAWVYAIISGVAMLFGIIGILSGQLAVTVPLLGGVMVGFLAALLLFGLAQLLAAIRDMAMNSWKQVILLQDVREHQATGAHLARLEGPIPPAE